MPQAQNTTSSLTPEMQILWDKVFLERAQLETVYDFLTDKEDHPRNAGKVHYFTRTTAFTPTTAALTEGTTPTGIAFTSQTVSATVEEYGETTQVSSMLSLTGLDARLKEKVETFGQLAAEKMDLIRLTQMATNATVQYANQAAGASALRSTDTLDVADLRYVVLSLKLAKAPKFGAPVGSLNKGGAYRGVISSKGYYDLLGDSTAGAFTAINIATSDSALGQVKDQSIKRLANVDIVESNHQYSVTAGASAELTAYSNLFAGKGAVKEISIGSSNPRIIMKSPGAGDTSNPLDMYSTLSFKIDAWTVVVANSAWLIDKRAV